mmetsp:Transcript_19843/g.55170  ORF Transcript_19843/g.55170 Transcript_19843/m.55170 type:complete len:251 (-) Transcript_19843:2546-3298(-)
MLLLGSRALRSHAQGSYCHAGVRISTTPLAVHCGISTDRCSRDVIRSHWWVLRSWLQIFQNVGPTVTWASPLFKQRTNVVLQARVPLQTPPPILIRFGVQGVQSLAELAPQIVLVVGLVGLSDRVHDIHVHHHLAGNLHTADDHLLRGDAPVCRLVLGPDVGTLPSILCAEISHLGILEAHDLDDVNLQHRLPTQPLPRVQTGLFSGPVDCVGGVQAARDVRAAPFEFGTRLYVVQQFNRWLAGTLRLSC